jgi:hypothetical protein
MLTMERMPRLTLARSCRRRIDGARRSEDGGGRMSSLMRGGMKGRRKGERGEGG